MNKSKKIYGRWSTEHRENLGVIYTCPSCSNKNREPLFNSNGKPYCSNCLVSTGLVHIMQKRTMYSHYIGKRIRK